MKRLIRLCPTQGNCYLEKSNPKMVSYCTPVEIGAINSSLSVSLLVRLSVHSLVRSFIQNPLQGFFFTPRPSYKFTLLVSCFYVYVLPYCPLLCQCPLYCVIAVCLVEVYSSWIGSLVREHLFLRHLHLYSFCFSLYLWNFPILTQFPFSLILLSQKALLDSIIILRSLVITITSVTVMFPTFRIEVRSVTAPTAHTRENSPEFYSKLHPLPLAQVL